MLSTAEFLRIAKALGDARRLAILERIASCRDAACQSLCNEFPVSQPTRSHHLRVLAAVGLIEMRRDGLYVYYRLRADVVRDYVTALETRLQVGRLRARGAAKGS